LFWLRRLAAQCVWIEIFGNQDCDTEKSLYHLDEFFVSGRLDRVGRWFESNRVYQSKSALLVGVKGNPQGFPFFFAQENVHKRLSGFKRNPASISNKPPSTVI